MVVESRQRARLMSADEQLLDTRRDIIHEETPLAFQLLRVDEVPPVWRREFPVFGAVSGTVGCMAAMEAIKVLAGFGDPLAGIMVTSNLRDMTFSRRKIQRRSDCDVCGNA